MQGSDTVVVRAREGHDDAYRMLVEQHSRALFRLAFRMTGHQQDAEDVVQETLLRAFRQIHRYESRASFGTWLHRIAANCSLDLIRARKRRAWVAELPEVTDRDPGPDRMLYSSDVQRSLAQALDELSAQERTAFVLRHFEGQSIEEIAAALGLNTSAAKNSVFRAVQKLRRRLEPLVGVEL